MKKIEFKITIAAAKQKVWDIMLAHGTYEEWCGAGWAGSTYTGEWNQDEHIRFVGPSGEGTLAHITEFNPFEIIKAEHVAIIKKGGEEDRTSDVSKSWVGSMENYYFTESNGATDLKVEIQSYPEWEKIFTDGWPKALNKLKEICERKGSTNKPK